MNQPSVFNLSPAEKLKLVEDLWDDLASNPENVPVHSWQPKSYNAGKIGSKKIPTRPSPGMI